MPRAAKRIENRVKRETVAAMPAVETRPLAKEAARPKTRVTAPVKVMPAIAQVAEPVRKVTSVTIDEANAGQRIDNFLIGHLKGVPKSHVYRILRSGEVRVNKGRIDQTYKLADGDVVRVPPVRVAEPQNAYLSNTSRDGNLQAKMPEKPHQRLRFIFEDDAILAIDKPAGMAVHGGSGISVGVIEALRQERPDAKFLELVHRLDRETSGVLLIAKKRAALVAMHAMLRGDVAGAAGRIEKHYFALVQGDWPDEKRHVRIKLAKYVTKAGERRVAVDEEDGQEAHTIFTRLERHGVDANSVAHATMLDCDIRTGRTHQIRVHLASLGYPIIGDDKYGDFTLNKHVAATKHGGLKRMFLHARSMAFTHPITGEKMKIESPLPSDLTRYINYLKANMST